LQFPVGWEGGPGTFFSLQNSVAGKSPFARLRPSRLRGIRRWSQDAAGIRPGYSIPRNFFSTLVTFGVNYRKIRVKGTNSCVGSESTLAGTDCAREIRVNRKFGAKHRSGTLATLLLSLSVPVLGGIASAADPRRTIQQSIRDISRKLGENLQPDILSSRNLPLHMCST